MSVLSIDTHFGKSLWIFNRVGKNLGSAFKTVMASPCFDESQEKSLGDVLGTSPCKLRTRSCFSMAANMG